MIWSAIPHRIEAPVVHPSGTMRRCRQNWALLRRRAGDERDGHGHTLLQGNLRVLHPHVEVGDTHHAAGVRLQSGEIRHDAIGRGRQAMLVHAGTDRQQLPAAFSLETAVDDLASYFLSDRLHMNDKGYQLWTTRIREYLDADKQS